MSDESFGLCHSCRHQRLVSTTRGSVFSLCERSRSDSSYPRYPRMPVLSCRGWEPSQRPAGSDPSPRPPAGSDPPPASAKS